MKRTIVMLLLNVLLAGCTSRSEMPGLPSDRQEQVLFSGTKQAEVVWKDGEPLELRLPDGPVVPFRNGEAPFEDQIALFVPEGEAAGHVEIFRQPQAVNRQSDKMPFVYLKTGSQQQVVTEGFKGEPYVDPADGKFCWTARVCNNPECASQTSPSPSNPKLFSHEIRGVVLRADGKLDWWGANQAEVQSHAKCPVCGKHTFVNVYEPPEVAAQKEALAEELAKVRAVRDRAAAARQNRKRAAG